MVSGVRRFEMVEGSSAKFWQIQVDGASFTVTFGRLGTAGQTKTTTAASPAAAQAEADKLIREKTKKGYQEVGGPVVWRPPAHVGTERHVQRFMNFLVSEFNPDADPEEGENDAGRRAFPTLRDLHQRVFFVGITWDDSDEDFDARIDALLADPKVGELKGLLIGPWYSEVCEEGPSALVEKLIANAHKLTSLKGLFIGEIIQEECEISWLHHMDYGPLLRALPNLEEFVVRGGDGLRFSNLSHPNLRTLTVQTGGLSPETARDIAAANLPELRTLTLWLGSKYYGGETTVADLAPLLDGARLPKLEHLGLQDAEIQDEIAAAVAKAPILGRLKGLDLSMGVLSDKGAQALLDSPGVRGLVHLNLRHHYLSADMVKKIKGLGIEVDVSDRREGDDEDRYIEVSE
jgi:predicted DNA-binding WGR domain protein